METATQQQKVSAISVKKTLIAGSLAGIISVIVSNLLAWGIMSANDYQFEMLNGFSITLSAFFVNLIGAFIFRFIQKKSKRAIMYYAILSVVMAILMSINTSTNPMEPNIAAVANPLHYLVAILSLVLIPLFMKRGQS
ncbi:hypothetical protein [Bacillus horti]|uniref:Membrane protein n=1 Tax=Caldalkalibacillus horti TaxID=77523 RepID=A0ABT9W485_9BACI|nr:hypothetical protein [Bacillus horti]MDQ0167884.1 putative membrane protein [Bacillus horti]